MLQKKFGRKKNVGTRREKKNRLVLFHSLPHVATDAGVTATRLIEEEKEGGVLSDEGRVPLIDPSSFPLPFRLRNAQMPK